MSDKKGYHMSPDEFRRMGRNVVDWVARYMESVSEYPVLSQSDPGEIRQGLPASPPDTGESFDVILEDVDRVIMPGITHWQSPNFFAFFPANTSGPSILGELLSAGLGVQGMLWATSPACTELETHVLDWLAEMLDLPERFRSTSSGGGVIQDSASSAALCALLAARERATAYQGNETGSVGRLTAYVSTQTHSSVEKGVMIAGIGRSHLRRVAVDSDGAMRVDHLRELICRDRAEGLVPAFVCGTAGTTSSNAMDPLPAMGAVCREESIWFHVDAAMAGSAAVCPEFRRYQAGLEYADSYCFNPHKWLFTNFDCDCFYVSDRHALVRTLSILPEYLKNAPTESGQVIDYRDWQIALGRRFRALKLWFVIRYYGVQGLQYHIRRHVELARRFAGWVEASPAFELAAPVPLNLVCFRHRSGDGFNRRLLDRVNGSGEIYLTHTVLDDRFTLRLCIGQTGTDEEHVLGAWQCLQRTAGVLESERGTEDAAAD